MPSQLARLSQAAVVLALAAASLAASAQIHRCKDENGQTVLSDRPCGVDSARQDAPKGSAGGAVDRIAAPQMVSARMRDVAGQYDFIPERAVKPSAQQQGK